MAKQVRNQCWTLFATTGHKCYCNRCMHAQTVTQYPVVICWSRTGSYSRIARQPQEQWCSCWPVSSGYFPQSATTLEAGSWDYTYIKHSIIPGKVETLVQIQIPKTMCVQAKNIACLNIVVLSTVLCLLHNDRASIQLTQSSACLDRMHTSSLSVVSRQDN